MSVEGQRENARNQKQWGKWERGGGGKWSRMK